MVALVVDFGNKLCLRLMSNKLDILKPQNSQSRGSFYTPYLDKNISELLL